MLMLPPNESDQPLTGTLLSALRLTVAAGLIEETTQPLLPQTWVPITVKVWLEWFHCMSQLPNPVTAGFPVVWPVRSPKKLNGIPSSASKVDACWVNLVSLPP